MDLCGVHPALSIEKEYPPGMPDRDVYTIAGRDGETAVGYAVVQGEYKVNVNIAAQAGGRLANPGAVGRLGDGFRARYGRD